MKKMNNELKNAKDSVNFNKNFYLYKINISLYNRWISLNSKTKG